MKYKIITLTTLLLISSGLAAAGNLELTKMSTEPDPMQIGGEATIHFQLANVCQRDETGSLISDCEDLDDVKLEFEDQYPFKAKNDTDTEWRIRELRRGEVFRDRVHVEVNPNAVQADHDLKFWTSTGGSDFRQTQYLRDVPIRVDQTSLIVNHVDFPDRVSPGSKNTMEIELDNLANSEFRDIDVKLNIEEEDVSVASSDTSRKRIPYLPENEMETVQFELGVDEDADNGVYNVPIQLEYKNNMGDPLQNTETTGVIVGGSPEVDVGLESTNIRTAGTRDTITLNVINKGHGESRFTEIAIQEGENFDIISERSEYLGTMISDDFQTAEFDFYVNEGVENFEIPVEVEFVDEDGQRQIETFTVNNRLFTDAEARLYGFTDGGGLWIFAGVITVLAVLGGLYYRRRKAEE